MTLTDNIEEGRSADKASTAGNPKASRYSLFDISKESKSRIIGLTTVIALMISGTLTFLILIGFTPILPNNQIVLGAAAVNGVLAAILFFLIGREVYKILRSRRKGHAASRLHVRIIGLFCLVAAFPAILVAIVAGITLDLGLDRWFEIRTKRIVESSVSIARAYMNESTRVLMGNTLSMAADLDRNRKLYILDRRGFDNLFTIQSRGRGFAGATLLNGDGIQILKADVESKETLPPVPPKAIESAKNGDPVHIPPGPTNYVSAVFKLREIPDTYLYSIVAVQPAVLDALRVTEINSADYRGLEENRLPFQIAFAILYLGICLIVLLSAIWMGISVANRIVSPIRRLMFAAEEVSSGNLDVKVDSSQSEGDLRFLSDTFNVMLSELRTQQSELLSAHDLMDQRAHFIEAVLSGVSAAVIGVDTNGYITIANKSAMPILGIDGEIASGKLALVDRVPELGAAFSRAIMSGKSQYHEQITIMRDGRERTLNVQVTAEYEETPTHSFVLTLDDITDLVSAQRNTAWADVARRIAHEIKNPLTPIQLSAERIRRRYGKQITEDKEIFDSCTDTIIRQVSDIGKMVDEFSAFARMPAPEMAMADLKKVVRETVFMQKVGNPDIDFELTVSERPLDMIFDQRMLSQALINVIKNSVEAIEAVKNDESTKGKILIQVASNDNQATIEIIDNGKGLPEANRQRLLEPYMTTREKGTGLGLAIVRKILEDHGGIIELMDAPETSEGGRGAMMRLTLPIKIDDVADTNSSDEISKIEKKASA